MQPGHWWHHLGPLSTSVSGQGRSGTHFLLLSFRVSGSLRFATHLVNAICVRGCSGAQLSAAQSEQIRVASYDARPDHAPFYTTVYDFIPFHAMLCDTVWFHIIPHHPTKLHQDIPYYNMPCHITQYHALWCHVIPYHTIRFLTIPYHSIQCYTVSLSSCTASSLYALICVISCLHRLIINGNSTNRACQYMSNE